MPERALGDRGPCATRLRKPSCTWPHDSLGSYAPGVGLPITVWAGSIEHRTLCRRISKRISVSARTPRRGAIAPVLVSEGGLEPPRPFGH